MSELTALPPAIRSYVHGYVARGRRLALVRRAGLALTVMLLWGLICCGIDRFVQVPAGLRLAALLAGATAGIAMLAGPLRRYLGREADWVAVAEEIEGLNPRFDQRLVTVTSRLLGRPEHRGSDEILEHLVYQVDREVSAQRSAALLPLRSAAAPWLALLLAVAAAVGLCFVHGLGLPRLAARFAAPWAAFPPVTTAGLMVYPGNLDVPQSNPLEIDAEAQRLEGSQVWLSLSDDGKTWSRSAMTGTSVGANGDGRYSFTLASVDRDMQYFVSGGDARSPLYTVRVLRRPAVAEFSIRYTYPPYTGKPPMAVVNTDGVIEAPVGTEALLTVTSTEPLELALFTGPGGEKTLLARAGADNVRQCRLTVQRDGRYQLDLVSTREVTGAGPPTTEIRAQPDRPPIIRLAEAGATLRLNPRDILPLSYEALDDYGIDSITVRVQTGTGQTYELPAYPEASDAAITGSTGSTSLPQAGSPQAGSPQAGSANSPQVGALIAGPALPPRRGPFNRQVSGEFDLDLARLPVTIGDVLTIVMSAKDTGGQSTSAPAVQVLVSPRSIGPDAYDRMADLGDASRLADALADELAAAMKSADAPASGVGGSMSAVVAVAQRDRHVCAALESAAMARRALLRAVAHGASPPLCVALAASVDAAQTVSHDLSELLRSRDAAGAGQWAAAIESIRHACEVSRQIQSNLKTISQGERAAAILADRESAVSTERHVPAADGKAAERLKQAVQRMREDIASGAADLGLDANASDFESRLRSKISSAASAVASQNPVDFAAAARDWARQPLPAGSTGSTDSTSSPQASRAARERDRRGELSERMLAAAEAEAVRHDADLVRARDLQLASKAAAVLNSGPRAGMNELAAVLSALQQDHELNRRPRASSEQTDTEHRHEASIREAAVRARQELALLAGEVPGPATARSNRPGTMPALAQARAEKAETLAMLAGAQSARHEYAGVAETDRALRLAVERLVTPSTGPSLRHAGSTSSPQAATGRAPEAASASSETSEAQLAQQARLDQTSLEVSRSMNAARALDGFSSGQQKLADETRHAGAESAPALADRQRGLADQISQLAPARPAATAAGVVGGSEDPNWRDRAVATLLSAQVQLSAMPQQLTEALTAAGDCRRAVQRSKSARRDADAASAEHKPAAARAADQADQDAAEALRRLQAAAAPLAPVAGEALGAALAPFSPEADASRAAISGALLPAMKSLSDAFGSDDSDAAARAAGTLRQAIEAVQVELAKARDQVAQRDPLVAAKWFARAAADALYRKPPDFPMALTDQDLTTAALAGAWDASIHRAAALRLAELPALQALYAPEPIAGDSSRLAGAARPTGSLGASVAPSIARNRRRLSPRDTSVATPHQGDPAGYEAALRAYFEALGNVGGK